MPHTAGIAERFAFGRPVEHATAETPVAARPGTAFIGRILISAIFIITGLHKLVDPAGTAAYIAQAGLPYPHFLAIAAGLVEVVGGSLVVLGLLTRLTGILMFLYLIPVTLVFHHFWTLEGMQRQMQMTNFLKNLAIMGGLLMLFAFGPGPFSVDRRIRRPIQP